MSGGDEMIRGLDDKVIKGEEAVSGGDEVIKEEEGGTEVAGQARNDAQGLTVLPSSGLTVLPSSGLTVSPSSGLTVSEKDTAADFPEQWRAMFNHVFVSVPTIFIPLKDILPEIENNVIKVVVKNDIQKEHFEAKIREALEYLRTHYNEQIDDILVKTNEKLETKKIIYDVKDKLQNFKEQNEEFEDFLQILELKMKD